MGLLRSASVFSSLTMVSRVFGLIRDQVLATSFGPGIALDAFLAAFKIPNFLRRLFAEGAFSQAFVPVLGEYRVQQGDTAVRELVARAAGSLGLVLSLVTIIGILVVPWLILEYAQIASSNQQKLTLTAQMLRLTFPYILFISLTALAAGVLNTYGRFAVTAFTPVFLNLCLIAAALLAAPHFPEGYEVMALAWGVLIAGIVQLLFQFPFLKRMNFLVWPKYGFRDEGVKRIMRLMGPALLGASVVQINLLLDVVIALVWLPDGSVSWLTFSDRMVEFPLGVFGIAISTVVLPSLSKEHAQTSQQGFARIMDWGLRWSMLIGLPAMLGLILLAGPVLTTIFNYNAFNQNDVYMSQLSLYAYASGLLAFILVKVLAPGFYARQDTKTPVKIALKAMLVNIVLNIVFVVFLLRIEFVGPHAGLALATSISAFVNAGLLFWHLRRAGHYQPIAGWSGFALQLLAALTLMSLVLLLGVPDISTWFAWPAWQRVLHLSLWVALGAVSYFAGLYLSGFRLDKFRALHANR